MMGRNDLSNWIRNTASRTADPVILAATVEKKHYKQQEDWTPLFGINIDIGH